MAVRGFVLTPTYRIVDGRPAVHLYGVLEDGEPVLVVDDRLAPYFFVRAVDAGHVAGARVVPTDLRTFAGEPVVRVEVALPRDVPPLRARLAAAGVPTYEADLRFAYRWLIDRGILGAFAVEGPFERRPGIGRVYRNPALAPAAFTPRLRVLSLDVETSLDATTVYSIAVAGAGGERVFLVGDAPVAGAEVVPDERTLIARFLAHVRAADPDVLTGWNVCDFDLAVLLRCARRSGVRFALGRADDELELLRDPGFTREARAVVPGRVVLDGLALLRSSFYRLDDYTLETAARTLLGRGKLFAPDHRGAAIEAAYREDPAALAAYNLEDARLVLAILERTGLIELTVRRSLLTGMQLDRVSAQIASVDSLYLRALRARGRVAPSVEGRAEAAADIVGGLVLDSRPGLYRNIVVFDFRSLYPSLIRTFNIDPLVFVPAPPWPAAHVRTPGGAVFRTDEEGILPALVARLWEERARARAAGDTVGAQAIKILMNSLFGVLGSPASRLFAPAVANAITTAGQHDPPRGGGGGQPRPSRHLRRHGLAVRRRGRGRPRARGGARARAVHGDRAGRRRRARSGIRLHEPARARIREGLRALLHARGARRHRGQQEAVRGTRARGRPGAPRAGRARGGAARLEPSRPGVPARAPRPRLP